VSEIIPPYLYGKYRMQIARAFAAAAVYYKIMHCEAVQLPQRDLNLHAQRAQVLNPAAYAIPHWGITLYIIRQAPELSNRSDASFTRIVSYVSIGVSCFPKPHECHGFEHHVLQERVPQSTSANSRSLFL